jgi:hypothetical protein
MKILKTSKKQREANKKYYQQHKENAKKYRDNYKNVHKEEIKEKNRIYRLLKTFNLSIEEYNTLLSKQNNCCAICGINEHDLKHKLSIDHDHISGKIRGLLCNKCNSTLGFLSENLEFFDKAKEYLIKNL